MYRRKIQLIAGSTYSVSLPKDWIVKNHLKEKNELIITEKNDQTLLISSKEINEKELKEINLEMEEYAETIDRILFAVYYLGIEKINILSKKEFPKDFRAKVRKTLTHMSGTEISYEDKRKISIRVLLDKYKVDLMQVLYRMSLITY